MLLFCHYFQLKLILSLQFVGHTHFLKLYCMSSIYIPFWFQSYEFSILKVLFLSIYLSKIISPSKPCDTSEHLFIRYPICCSYALLYFTYYITMYLEFEDIYISKSATKIFSKWKQQIFQSINGLLFEFPHLNKQASLLRHYNVS